MEKELFLIDANLLKSLTEDIDVKEAENGKLSRGEMEAKIQEQEKVLVFWLESQKECREGDEKWRKDCFDQARGDEYDSTDDEMWRKEDEWTVKKEMEKLNCLKKSLERLVAREDGDDD